MDQLHSQVGQQSFIINILVKSDFRHWIGLYLSDLKTKTFPSLGIKCILMPPFSQSEKSEISGKLLPSEGLDTDTCL